jgi:hypothetical protein
VTSRHRPAGDLPAGRPPAHGFCDDEETRRLLRFRPPQQQGAYTGPAAADVGHCRVNLLDSGSDAAQRFTASWQQAVGATYHPWGDIVTVIGFLDDLRGNWGPERNLVEELLAPAVAELGGNSR